jgi:PKD repeat protein
MATVSGGVAPLSYAWDTAGSGTFTAGGASTSATYATAGNYTAKVRVTDSATPAHTQILTQTVSVTQACVKTLDFGLAEVTTSGCLARVGGSNPAQYTTTSAINVNGIPVPPAPPLTHYTITLPGGSVPGGEVSLGTTGITVGGFTAFRGAVDWKLPAGAKGDEKQIAMLSVPQGTKLKGLSIGGSIALKLGFRNDGSHYATFVLNVDLPDIFKSGPEKQSGGVSGTGALRVDLQGVHYDGLRLEAHNVWVGKLQVQQVCFSFVAGGSQAVAACPVPSLEGKPFLQCNDNNNLDRWDGNAVLILPTASKPRLALFGGVAGGRLSKLGGFVDNLGTSLPIAQGVYLTRIGVGLCVYPPPFKLRGDVGVSALPIGGKSTLTINGSFLYTDSFGPDPWSLQLSGNMSVYDRQVGSGTLTIRPTGSIDFGLNTSLNLFSVVSIDGRVVGWVETSRHAFNIDGNVRACLRSLCASATAVLSSVGLAGCLDLGHIVYYVLVRNSDFHWYTPWRVHWERREILLKAGFGYRWHASGVSLFGGSCDMGSFSARRSSIARAAAGGFTVHIAPGTQATAVRIAGGRGAPKVIVTEPDGTKIASPRSGGAESSPGHFVLVENPSDKSTSLLLINPAPGAWSISSAGTGPQVTGVQTAPFLSPPDITGTVVASGRAGGHIASLAYAVPAGDSISLVERGAREEHTITSRVAGRACPGPSRPGGEPLRCAEIRFQPAFGPAGTRELFALVTHNGVPVLTLPVASFQVGAPALPSRPGRLQLVRRNGGVVVAWSPSAAATGYTVSVTLSDGRMLGLTPAGRCRGVLVRGVSASLAVSAEVAGLRPDLVSGSFVRIRLAAGRARAGAGGALPRGIC